MRAAKHGLALVVALAVAAVLAAPASANVSHIFAGAFGASGSNPANTYPLTGPNDVEVDQASHDFYATDPGNHRVEKFDATGHLILMFGDGVDHTSGGDVCTVASGHTCKAGVSGSGVGQLETPTYLAVDNSGGTSTGAIYVGDTGDNLVSKFDSGGNLVTSWGANGQKDGSDAEDLPVYGPLYGVAVGGPKGELYIGGTHYSDNVWQYSPNGAYEGPYQNVTSTPWLKADPNGNLYYSAPAEGFFSPPTIWQAALKSETHGLYDYFQLGTGTQLTGLGFDPSSLEFYQDTGSVIDHYSADCVPSVAPCDPSDTFGSTHLFGAEGLAVDGTSHTVYVANSASNDVATFSDARPIVITEEPKELTDSGATLAGSIDPADRGAIVACRFEFGFDRTYGHTVPCAPDPASGPPGSNFTVATPVTGIVEGLSPGTKDHYRLVATNAAGATSFGIDHVFRTTEAPAIDGLTVENITATSAELIAQVNPNGLPARYRFEYGTTPTYGQEVVGTVPAGSSDQQIVATLTDLTPHFGYHFRLVVDNTFKNTVTGLVEGGVTTSEDHTFTFYHPSCPNENVRQQTQANFLPDCRAYELVSPSNANGTQLFPGGPNTGYASSPSRFTFTGLFASIEEAGGTPLDTVGDLYVATRTSTGWRTKYVGLPSDQAAVDGGPPQGLFGQGGTKFLGNRTSVSNGDCLCADIIQNNVLTNPEMSVFLNWNDGSQGGANPTPIASNAPYLWNADGDLLDRWPTNLAVVPDGSYPPGSNVYPPGGYVQPGEEQLTVAPGGTHALDCPAIGSPAGGSAYRSNCPGEVNASSDLSHFVFASEWNVFATGGQLGAPGSVYDNDTSAGSVTVASLNSAGEDIPPEPTDAAGDPLQIPAVSSNGSRILISSPGTGPCGLAHCPTPPCGGSTEAIHCPNYPGHLYMRVDGAVTYDISRGADVTFVGMTSDGSKVYFTTARRLTSEDTDSSIDLYMWSAGGDQLTLASAGSGGSGNSDSCQSSFVKNCGVTTYSNISYCQLVSGLGGNCRSDNSLAAQNGDIYFLSPEILDGSRGIPNQANIYDFRHGAPQYVTTVSPDTYCYKIEFYSGSCGGVESDGPVVRMQVSPDDSKMAFVTASQVTQYDNAGFLEMYTYDPVSRNVICVSCNPSGEPPTSNIGASQDGLFMSNDGRAFFTTNDALVHADTNEAQDVYEYVDGHPQLITPGTGDTTQSVGLGLNEPGLSGVSADGTDVYFSTFQSLVRQDHNGLFVKFYDARAGGGFPAPAPPPPCNAADECHGSGSGPPVSIKNGTAASLGAGSHVSGKSKSGKRTRHRHRGHRKPHRNKHSRGRGARR